MSERGIICYARCWGCSYGQHFDPPQWHTWADTEDIEANPEAGKSRCGCECALGVGEPAEGSE